MAQNDYVLVRSLIEYQGRDRQQRVEPASGLVNRLADECSREVLFEGLLILKRIMVLCERHGTGIEPAVDNFRYTVHLLAAARAGDGNGIDVGAMQLDIVRAVLRHALQLFNASDRMLMAALALPDIQRSTPVTVTADTPILYVLQPVTETALADALRNPVDCVVVADQVVLHSSHLDEPGLTRIVDQRRVAAPAVRVAVLELRSIEQQTSLVQILQNFRICLLYKQASERSILGHVALAVYQLYKRQIVVAANLGIIFTECGSDVYHAGTIGQSYVGIAGYEEAFLVLLRRYLCRTVIQRLIFLILQIRTLVGLQDLVSGLSVLRQAAQNRIQQSFRHVVGVAVRCLHLYIGFIRIYAERYVGGKGPGSGRPCQNVGILILHLEANDGGAFLYILVTLSDLVAGKRSTAAGAVGNDLEALIQKLLVPDLLQRPPLGLDEVIVIGYIRVLHIRPEADLAGELFPHALVFPYTLFTLLNERLYAVFLDLLLAVQTQHLLYFQLNGKSVGIPSGLTGYIVALHGTVTGDHVLDNTGQYVTDMGLAVRSGRTVIEHIFRAAFALVHTLLEDIILFPECFYRFFAIDEIHIRRHFRVHGIFLLHDFLSI